LLYVTSLVAKQDGEIEGKMDGLIKKVVGLWEFILTLLASFMPGPCDA
jgi:hypothetical protein